MEVVAVRLPEELVSILDKLSKEYGLSKSDILRSIVEEILIRYDFSLATRDKIYLMLRSCIESVSIVKVERR